MEYDYNHDCWVGTAVLPATINALCTAVDFDTVVLVNECLNEAAKHEAYAHEIRHISRGDLFSDKSVEELEK